MLLVTVRSILTKSIMLTVLLQYIDVLNLNCNGKYLGESSYPLHITTLYLRPANQLSVFMLKLAPVSYA